jgi:hypothetical protein
MDILNEKFLNEKRKVAIIMDNCTSHYIESGSLSNIKIFFLPSNTTPISQPLDAGFKFTLYVILFLKGIIELCKRSYRKKLIKKKLDFIYRNENLEEKLFIDFYSAVNLFAQSFLEIPKEIIVNCFKNRGFNFKFFPVDLQVYL